MTIDALMAEGVTYLSASPNVTGVSTAAGVLPNSATWTAMGARGTASVSMSLFDGTDPATWSAKAKTRWDGLLNWMAG